ncbi:complex I assembly factor ACAD9, mitochondrial [Zerene cesonia]|uniref:complex I assembly factor ACAD9, mitochondrial n=1 Tax=Zerene cesonia TaxID=33412 RepID=UPI0018E59BE4|nr:complex I assembly factor ACAD9, mitochondrial [Zerene cesonia]
MTTMNIACKLTVLPYQSIRKTFIRKLRISAFNYDSAGSTQPKVQEEKFDFEDLKTIERVERRNAKIEPFMKNVFVSKYNRDMLAYPEILNKEENTQLENRLSVLEKVFSDPKSSVDDRKTAMRNANIYAATVGLTNGGLAANHTELLRYLELIGTDLQLGQQISDHWVGLNVLKKGLNPDDYMNIVDDLKSGDDTITLCIKERISERLAQPDFRSTAELDDNGIWRLNGEKVCINPSGYLLPLCIVENNRIMAFLVHPEAEGVIFKDNYVLFNNVPATPLQKATDELLSKVLGANRLHTATLCRISLSQAMKSCLDYVRPRFLNGKPLSELTTIRSVIGDTLIHTYASESVEYFIAGLLDGYLEPDAEVEMAMSRNFMANHAQSLLLKLLAIPGVEKQKECLHLLENMRSLSFRGESVDEVNFFIALQGLHYAGNFMSTEIKKMRNPFLNPSFVFKKVLANKSQESDNPKLDLHLAEHLHPTLKPASDNLEYCVKRMRFVCETMLARHGLDVATAYTELTRLAEAATEILAMTSVLGRASRSYCIGVRNAENEMKIAASFVEASKDRTKRLLNDIVDGEYLNLDHFRVQFGKKLLDSTDHIVERPTARVFW